ncbi:DEAD/DEAH box helicase [Pelagicoccus sp. SDUM812003]|uniref:DEAD/DEAH box helicase n=1 Tax=Pelagicoccus sp. SDUM812003 TaxID=3041267 RepID=UPI00280FEF65|nr:DEAD/DEAH box helicase [Pelagicoccus sp. SDUM812003]MDQ8201632.1 DEAD/DEAH box helicase [Pelagicoccus sp. SDUM812003]
MPFSGLGLSDKINSALSDLGFTQPTPIQEQAIPLILEGHDLIGSAQTGTGKTAAFGLPILQRIQPGKPFQCLILEPTRELAAQVEESLGTFAKHLNIEIGLIYGGVKYGGQLDMIKRGAEIIVATPGRLLDHLQQGALQLKDLDYLVLDEVDRMLDMGFLPDVKRIVERCSKDRQTLLFTATLPPAIKTLTNWVLNNPKIVEIGQSRSAAETVSHAFYPVVERQKYKLLIELLQRTHFESVLIFCRTKFNADMISRRLERLNHSVAVLHSDRTQRERTEALKGFKDGKFEVLVATDIAARGLDIAGVTHVINYDVPLHAEDYVHRIGRTGRASKEGDAFTLLTEDEVKNAAAIEHFIGKKVERKKLDGFNYMYSALFNAQEKAAAGGARSRLRRG